MDEIHLPHSFVAAVVTWLASGVTAAATPKPIPQGRDSGYRTQSE